jgi:sigma-54 dependent transcriptional regulator, acetoin dehydrogenase operon transcriptional activator AcoR
MKEFRSPRAPGRGRGRAGLVLLYAENHSALPAVWLLEPGRNVVGRAAPATIELPVEAVSRVHAEITQSGARWLLRDLGSTNGVLLDGARVQEIELEAGQEVRIGDAILEFVPRDAELMAPYRLDGSMDGGQSRRRGATGSSALVGGYRMDVIASEVERIAKSSLSVVLLGESGTGKEVIAQTLHDASARRGPFIAVNCAAIPHNLLESELFGFKKGAFSGADRDKTGLFRAADGGTLLLDEIGDMPLAAQVKVLRVLQSREIYPIGSTTPESVDVRIVCATHRDLRRLQHEGRFREDLYARLNEYQLHLPPLRDRKEDIYMLLQAFLKRHGGAHLEPSFRFMTALLHYDWPYNVRELEACVKRAVALADDVMLDAPLLPDTIREAMADYGQSAPTSHTGRPAPLLSPRPGPPTAEELIDCLKRHDGNVAAVGRELGKARMQIHRWVQRHGLDLDDYRA